ncbi:hypothetical protein GCM10027610_084830 [Dactylosporangium cerinum]
MSTSTIHAPARTNRSDATSHPRALVQNSLAPGTVDLPSLVPLMYALMFRNIASDGFIFSDPQAARVTSASSSSAAAWSGVPGAAW